MRNLDVSLCTALLNYLYEKGDEECESPRSLGKNKRTVGFFRLGTSWRQKKGNNDPDLSKYNQI